MNENPSSIIDPANLRHIAEIAALIAAACYFIYRTISGYLITNLSIKISCKRQHLANTMNDILAVSATLIKGDRGTICINDMKARITYTGNESKIIPFIGYERLSYTSERIWSKQIRSINWNKESKKAPRINLSPGEEMTFSSSCIIPSDSNCTIEVALIGNRLKSNRFGQWRSSIVSLASNAE